MTNTEYPQEVKEQAYQQLVRAKKFIDEIKKSDLENSVESDFDKTYRGVRLQLAINAVGIYDKIVSQEEQKSRDIDPAQIYGDAFALSMYKHKI